MRTYYPHPSFLSAWSFAESDDRAFGYSLSGNGNGEDDVTATVRRFVLPLL
jgi:hypothetical protein